ncbi:MAG: hypothetical protein WKF40_01890 [Thermoleophilaceae bacterium]
MKHEKEVQGSFAALADDCGGRPWRGLEPLQKGTPERTKSLFVAQRHGLDQLASLCQQLGVLGIDGYEPEIIKFWRPNETTIRYLTDEIGTAMARALIDDDDAAKPGTIRGAVVRATVEGIREHLPRAVGIVLVGLAERIPTVVTALLYGSLAVLLAACGHWLGVSPPWTVGAAGWGLLVAGVRDLAHRLWSDRPAEIPLNSPETGARGSPRLPPPGP